MAFAPAFQSGHSTSPRRGTPPLQDKASFAQALASIGAHPLVDTSEHASAGKMLTDVGRHARPTPVFMRKGVRRAKVLAVAATAFILPLAPAAYASEFASIRIAESVNPHTNTIKIRSVSRVRPH